MSQKEMPTSEVKMPESESISKTQSSPGESHNDSAKTHYDSAYSWIVCAAIFIGHMLTVGFSFAIGVYYVVFRDVFGHSAGVTSWISSLNLGTATFIGEYVSYPCKASAQTMIIDRKAGR